MAAFIGDFGKGKDGLHLFRINGTKAEIEKAIQDFREMGCEPWGEPYEFEKSHLSWSVLIRLWMPEWLEQQREKLREEQLKSRRKI